MLTPFEKRPVHLFAYVLAIIFAVEAAVMFALPYVVPDTTSDMAVAFVDAIMLTVLLSPMLWVLIVGPLSKLAELRQEILGAALTAQEEERQRLARELHDGLGQGLTTLLVGLRTIEEMTHEEAVKGVARDLRRIGGESHDEVRRIARGLRPAVLDDVGMVPALERFLNDVRQAYEADAFLTVECVDRPRLKPDVETALYRIVQEAVVNAVRHGRAKRIAITMRCRADAFELEVHDNGQGFDLNATLNRRTGTGPFGLYSIRERARLIGGDAVIESSTNSGTRVLVSVPLSTKT
ncbi:MAG: sensor histidine kinase [Planctomycetaceae bacterium]|nr:sensor histidine kinase [Planctomycetaceae bacterium]